MLSKYPKLKTVVIPHPPGSDCPSSTLPRLAVQDDHQDPLLLGGLWTARGCESAPIVLGRSRIFFREQKTLDSGMQWSNCDEDPCEEISPEVDFKRISKCVHLLNSSGYYYEGLSWHQASDKLRTCKVGTFLVRDSENANFLFTLSVQTKKGPTSIRIAYKCGHFRLDSEEELVGRMPVFETVTDLVEYYITVSKEYVSQRNFSCCWLDLAGEYSAPVELYYPLYRRVSSLKHLCRLTISQSLVNGVGKFPIESTVDKCKDLGLPNALQEYINDYPHCH